MVGPVPPTPPHRRRLDDEALGLLGEAVLRGEVEALDARHIVISTSRTGSFVDYFGPFESALEAAAALEEIGGLLGPSEQLSIARLMPWALAEDDDR